MISSPWLRRPLSLAVWTATALLGLVLSPLLLAAGALAERISGDRRLLAMTRVCCAYFLRGLAALAACGGLWLLSGCGREMKGDRIQALHWRLLRWFVRGVASAVRGSVDIRVSSEDSEAALDALHRDGPLLILSRHAGPADTILLIDLLLSEFDRRPSIVFKEAVALEPTIDLIAHRLPQAILDTSDPDECTAQIASVSARLGPRGVLLIYPEGGNFTEDRRRRALRSLRKRGESRAYRQARRMTHVLPPRPAGALAALAAAPSVPVVVAAHTGLGLAAYPIQIWRQLPVGRVFRLKMWLHRRDAIPAGDDGQRDWLNGCWQQVDEWIDREGEERPDGHEQPATDRAGSA